MFLTELDLRAYRPNEWVVLAPIEWKSKDAHFIVARGFITDLASVPRPLRGLLNVNGRSRRAAVLHDYLYCLQSTTRDYADDLFREALIAEGMAPQLARVYWSGVRIGGWRYFNERQRHPINLAYDFVPADYWEQHP